MFTSRESLAVTLAVTGLKARIRAAAVTHPELLSDPDTARVLRAVQEDRQREAVRVFRSILAAKGAERTFALLAPAFADILAWNALTDENPLNDGAGWEIATGRTLTGAEPVLGVSARVWSFLDREPGRAEPLVPSPRSPNAWTPPAPSPGTSATSAPWAPTGRCWSSRSRDPTGSSGTWSTSPACPESATRAPRTCWAPYTP